MTEAPLIGSCRLTICIMNCLSLAMVYVLRGNVSLSMVCMVKQRVHVNTTSITNDNTSRLTYGVYDNTWPYNETDLNERVYQTAPLYGASTVPSVYQGEFEWSRSFQGHVLSSYFYGYLPTIFLGGWLAGRLGAKHVISVGLSVSAVATLLIPVASRINDYLMIVLRVIIGATSATFYSAMMSLGGLWYTPHDRSLLTAITLSGASLGSMFVYGISALCCSLSDIDNGWPLTFYVTGGAQLLFCVPWVLLVYSSPDQHPRISRQERDYITTSTTIKTSITQRSPFPWLKAFTSPAVIAVVCAMVAHTWYVYMTMTSIPLYFQEVLKFPIKQNGMWLVLPHVVALATTTPFGYLADFLIRRHIFRTVVVRKLFQTTATIGCCILLVTVSFMDFNQRYFVAGILTAGNIFMSMVRCGYSANIFDIAPRYSGEISGISNTFATLSGILAPVVVGYFTTNGTKQEWQNVFYISAAVMFAGGLVFFIFAEGTVLPWALDTADLKPQLNEEDAAALELIVEKTKNDFSLGTVQRLMTTN